MNPFENLDGFINEIREKAEQGLDSLPCKMDETAKKIEDFFTHPAKQLEKFFSHKQDPESASGGPDILKKAGELTQAGSKDGMMRWFISRYFDLVIRIDLSGNRILGFQLCYARGTPGERLISWHEDGSYSHQSLANAVTDSQMAAPGSQKDCGKIDALLLSRFQQESIRLDKSVADFVCRIMQEHSG